MTRLGHEDSAQTTVALGRAGGSRALDDDLLAPAKRCGSPAAQWYGGDTSGAVRTAAPLPRVPHQVAERAGERPSWWHGDGGAQAQGANELAALRGQVVSLHSQGKYFEALAIAERYVALA